VTKGGVALKDRLTVPTTATGKSVDVTYDPGQTTGPAQLDVYVQLRKNNANYGQMSDISVVTLNPWIEN
jgi:hypothetical protein